MFSLLLLTLVFAFGVSVSGCFCLWLIVLFVVCWLVLTACVGLVVLHLFAVFEWILFS